MEKFILTFSFALLIVVSNAQSYQSLDTIKAPADFENIYSRPLYTDSLASSFVIFIKKEVKIHKHITHTEHVYILEGDGEMTLGDKKFKIKKGDMVFIPQNTPHSLKTTSKLPVKVVSLQSPMFDGKDRVFIE
ncbi:MAG: cupin domain-containing protein [Bacteroidetes bacterium]|nr:cupin domain-containing protein [Bacteroidota bacterium]